MNAIEPYAEILDELNGQAILKKIERIARVCYKSEDRIKESSAEKMVKMLIDHGHEAMLEHFSFSVKFVVDRGVSHEIVRHRVASFAQESTRYCNYRNEGEVTFIIPFYLAYKSPGWDEWQKSMLQTERSYLKMLEDGYKPQEARAVLPNSLKTEIIMTANLREWRHFMKLRTAEAAHPQFREVTRPLLDLFKERIPVIFDDICGTHEYQHATQIFLKEGRRMNMDDEAIYYECIKELQVPWCDGDGFLIENEYKFVQIGSEWYVDDGSNIVGGDVHLEATDWNGEIGWVEVSTDTLNEHFKEIKKESE